MNPSSVQPSLPSQNPNFPIPSLPQNPDPNCASSLYATHSSLNSLLSLSRQTLDSHSVLAKSLNPNIVPCPFNLNHLLPPESLFSHSLHCPSPQCLDLYPLNYRHTLGPPPQFHPKDAHFEGKQGSELCLSLDDYFADFGSNFFYKDCPGAVNWFDVDNSRKAFTLPGFLSIECVNFDGFSEGVSTVSERKGLRILASGFWDIKREVGRWSDYPLSYSVNVVCGILGSKMVKRSDLRKWLVANSPKYGVVIDRYMGDHMILLVRLCLKAIVREASRLVEVDEPKEIESDATLKRRIFECPVLRQILMWLGSQLCVLYGEVNGKFFAINMIKQCVLEGASRSLLFPLEEKETDSHNLGQESQSLGTNGIQGTKLEHEPVEMVDETIGVGVVFVSQVAAAVAALHERRFLEENIKHLRASQPLSRYQRAAEHTYVSERADMERKKRSNYRPIIDHDGLPRQASSKEETTRTKTKEEIFAEERDYKRRRMSYRGKKTKRTTLQVMRDIIEEYTEEITKAGGIGCFVKGAEEEGLLPSESPVTYDRAGDADEHRKGTSHISEAARGSPDHYSRRSDYDQHGRFKRFEDSSRNDFEQLRWHDHHDLHEDSSRSTSKKGHRDEYHSRTSKRDRSPGRSNEQRSHRKERDDTESTRATHYESGRRSSMSKYNKDCKSSYSSNSSSDFHVRKDDRKLDVRDRNHRRSSYENHTSGSLVQNGFNDRYNPLESANMDEDDVYFRPE